MDRAPTKLTVLYLAAGVRALLQSPLNGYAELRMLLECNCPDTRTGQLGAQAFGEVMRVGDYCKQGVVTVTANSNILEAAEIMRTEHVGFLVVLDPEDTARKPVGVLTDRDIVVQVTAHGVDPRSLTVADVMSREPLMGTVADDVNDAVQGMRIAGVRRIPVLTSEGRLTGVLAMDDVLQLVAGLVCDMCCTVRTEQNQERRRRAG